MGQTKIGLYTSNRKLDYIEANQVASSGHRDFIDYYSDPFISSFNLIEVNAIVFADIDI